MRDPARSSPGGRSPSVHPPNRRSLASAAAFRPEMFAEAAPRRWSARCRARWGGFVGPFHPSSFSLSLPLPVFLPPRPRLLPFPSPLVTPPSRHAGLPGDGWREAVINPTRSTLFFLFPFSSSGLVIGHRIVDFLRGWEGGGKGERGWENEREKGKEGERET